MAKDTEQMVMVNFRADLDTRRWLDGLPQRNMSRVIRAALWRLRQSGDIGRAVAEYEGWVIEEKVRPALDATANTRSKRQKAAKKRKG